jgi:hypothetical protein
VDRDRELRPEGLDQLPALLAVHRHGDAHHPGPAEVDEREVDRGHPVRDLAQALVHQRVARDVDAERGRRAAGRHRDPVPELVVGADDLGHRQVQDARRVAAGHRRDAQPARRGPELVHLPRHQRLERPEAALGQPVGGLVRRDDRDGARQPGLGDPVEVVRVEVRQDHEVEWREVVDLDGGIGQPAG